MNTPQQITARPVQVLRYRLTAGLLPSVLRTLEIGELARRASLAQHGGEEKRPSPPVLSGHTDAGPLQHRHAFYLPVDEDIDGLIDHLYLYAPDGFDAEILDSLRRLGGLYPGEAGIGWALQLEAMETVGSLQSTSGPWAPSLAWESATAFLLGRYPKRGRGGTPKLTALGEQRDGPEDQARREWALRQQEDPSLPNLVEVTTLPFYSIGESQYSWREFLTTKRWGTVVGCRFAYGLRLRFEAPIAGPIALGYGCHFGMGQFRSC